MASVVTMYDETTSGSRTAAWTLNLLTAKITVRELIRRRVYEEVQEYNLATPATFRGLVQPTDAERLLNGYQMRERRTLDWEKQYERAVRAFERGGFFVLVDDCQVTELDEEILLKVATEVSFIKLVPLVGG